MLPTKIKVYDFPETTKEAVEDASADSEAASKYINNGKKQI